jgi:polysaccharide biosynthesis/export protein
MVMKQLLTDQKGVTPVRLIVFALLFACLALDAGLAQESSLNVRGPKTEEYLISPGDQLEIRFFYSPELNEAVTVRSDGVISTQLIGDIKVSDLSPKQASTLLEQRYSSELVDPKIDVLVHSSARQRIFVDGEVGRPGAVDLVGPLTIAQAIASGGGLTSSARATSVLVIRHSAPQDPPKVIVVNLKSILKRSPNAEDVALHPYDIVYVPSSRIGNVNRFVDLYFRKNLPVYFGLSWAPF